MLARSKRATIRDVAAHAGVSAATVSNVLLGRNAATRAVADRVRAAADLLGYVADKSASQLRSGKAQVIAVLVPSLTDPFFTAIIAGIEVHAQAEGYDIIVASSNHDDGVEGTRLAALLAWRPSGLIIVPNSDAFPSTARVDRSHLPYVVVDRVPPDPHADSVAADNRPAAAEAAAHLLNCGHRSLLVVGSSFALANIRQRYAGVCDVMASHGLDTPPKLEVGLTFETVADRLAAWLSSNAAPSAYVTLTNFVTMGVLAHVSRSGLRVPDDVSLIGFDDYEWMRAATPAISAVRQDVDGLAAGAWALLKAQMKGDTEVPRHRTVPCSLVLRDSVARVGPPLQPMTDPSLPGRGKRSRIDDHPGRRSP